MFCCFVSSIPLLIPTNLEPLKQRVGRGNLNFVHFLNEIWKFGEGIGGIFYFISYNIQILNLADRY
jgi:hypothetical protein